MALPISYNVRNLKVRWQVTTLAIFGIALVVSVVIVLLSMARGYSLALRATGLVENAMLVQRGSSSGLTSWVPLNHRVKVEVDHRVSRDAEGKPLSSPEIVVINNMPRFDGEPTNVTLRGVTPRAFEVRGGIELVEGRHIRPGLNELIVGERIVARIRGIAIGEKIDMQNADWEVVGIFRSRGGAFEGEIWGDLDVVGPAFGRTGGSNVLVLRLDDPSTLEAFDREVRANPEMQLQLIQERKYYEDQAGALSIMLMFLAGFVGVVMGVGAVFGAMNTMYAIIAARTREIGTLRALGFSRRSIMFSFVMESVFLAAVGGALGCLIALPANGFVTSTGFASASFAEVAFAFRVTPPILGFAMAFAVAMGLAGGLLPSFQAARLPITSALREA